MSVSFSMHSYLSLIALARPNHIGSFSKIFLSIALTCGTATHNQNIILHCFDFFFLTATSGAELSLRLRCHAKSPSGHSRYPAAKERELQACSRSVDKS